MKTLVALLCLSLAAAVLGKDIVVGGREYSVATNLNNQLEWKLTGTTFQFVQDDGKCEIKNDRGKLIHTWDSPLQVSGAVASENGTALLVRVMTAKGFYHGITRFILTDGTWKVDEVMLSDHPDMAIRDRWIDELGAVADDGATAILHVGEADSDRTPGRKGFRMFYSWQTWDLNKTKRLGVGLKMSNAKK